MKYILVVLTLLVVSCKQEQPANPTIVTKQIDLSALDSLGCVYDWYVQDGVLKVTTVHDELNSELERLEYIKENFYE